MVLAPLLITLWAHLAMPEMGTLPPQRLLHRWYSPTQGRFISRDPIGFEGGQINLYQYVGNNPVSIRDPSGLVAEDALATLFLKTSTMLAEVAITLTQASARIGSLVAAEAEVLRKLDYLKDVLKLIPEAQHATNCLKELQAIDALRKEHKAIVDMMEALVKSHDELWEVKQHYKLKRALIQSKMK